MAIMAGAKRLQFLDRSLELNPVAMYGVTLRVHAQVSRNHPQIEAKQEISRAINTVDTM